MLIPVRNQQSIKTMILEIAVLDVIPGRECDFQNDFEKAESIISSMKGYIGHELKRCIEKPSRFVLLVRRDTLEDHTQGFRGSPEYQRWKSLLHRYYDPFPTVEHYESVLPRCDA
jgi:heme-degrading monooxygenase HmoA